MKRSRRKSENVSYWQSYSDMMAALLLIFVLIMAFTLLQDKKHTQEMTESMEKAKLEYEEQQKKLDAQQKIMDAQQEQIDNLVGIKADLIKALSGAFEGSDMAIVVDQKTGAIVFDSSILFDYNKYDLKKEAKTFLDEFFPKYFSVLMGKDFAPYISEIIIEGYTDDQGTYLYNLNLSQKRAFSIAQYCLDERNKMLEPDDLAKLCVLMTANGRSENNLIYDEKGEVDPVASRRVEFKFRLKDEEMIQEMQKILEK